MHKLIIARHGDYNADTESLDDDGIVGVRALATALMTEAIPPIVVVTSPELRAVETGRMLAELIPGVIRVDQYDSLGFDAEACKNAHIDDVIEGVADEAGTVILVTHDNVAHSYVNHYLAARFGSRGGYHPQLRYAEAIVIDVDRGHPHIVPSAHSAVI